MAYRGFLKLHDDDNVLVATESFRRGSLIHVDDNVYTADTDIPRFFKVAARDIQKDEPVKKSGMCIGVASEFIGAGQLVHTHNLRSDYLRSFTGNK